MTNTGRIATVALVATATLMVAGRASAQDEPTAAPGRDDATVVLHAVNYAALSRGVLDVAKARVAMVYEQIGVRVEWVDGEVSFEQRQDGRRHFSILLLSRDMAEKKIKGNGIEDGVLGQAHTSGGRASIFCDRIAATPGGLRHFSISLGDIIAHVVGHLLLGANSHSRSGLMRANIDVGALHLQSFDEKQSRTIRTTLNADPRPTIR
jgi:hypothetical protein